MASPFCLLKPMRRLTISSDWSIPPGSSELLLIILFFYLCFMTGLLRALLKVSTTPPNDASRGGGQSAGDDVVRPPDGQSAARKCPAVLAVACGMTLLGMLTFWGLAHEDRTFLRPFLASSAAALTFPVFLRFNLGVPLVVLSSSGLINLLVPGNVGSDAELGPAGFKLPLFLLLLGLMGTLLMLASFVNSEKTTFLFNLRSQGEDGNVSLWASASQWCSIFTQAAQMLLVLSFAGLLHLLAPTTKRRNGSIRGDLELPVLILFIAFMVSLVMVLLKITT